MAGLLYWLLSGLDFGGWARQAPDFVAVVYTAAVKWGCVLPIVLLGMFVTGVGIRNLTVMMRRRDRK
jgi:hypothetical protein